MPLFSPVLPQKDFLASVHPFLICSVVTQVIITSCLESDTPIHPSGLLSSTLAPSNPR